MDIRRNNYYQRVPVCGAGCNYIEMDSVNLISSCSCEIGNLISTNNNKETNGIFIGNGIINDFISLISSSNYIVIKCYKKVFNFNIFVTNLGNFLLIINFVGQVINLVLYIRQGNAIFTAYIENSSKETPFSIILKITTLKDETII